MDARTLSSCMGGVMSMGFYAKWCPEIERAMIAADAVTPKRAACLLGQVRQESLGLKYRQEVGGSGYLQGKPYWPYIGRGFIQCTWRDNYASFGSWAHSRRLISDSNFFVAHPGELANPRWAALTISWYWSLQHGWKWGTINRAADHSDWDDASHQINGGDYGLYDRRAFIQHALSLGDRILPQKHGEDLLAAMGFKNQKELDAHIRKVVASAVPKELAASSSNVETMIANAFQRKGRWTDKKFDGIYARLARRIADLNKPPAKSPGKPPVKKA